jgi:SEC-C motif-containing protein
MAECPCGSGKEFEGCCSPLINGEQAATTAEALMRSRYSAYVNGVIDYLGETLHPDYRNDYDAAATRKWAEQSDWCGLEIRSVEQGGENDDEGMVEFVASYKTKGTIYHHHELSRFCRHQGRWYYVDGKIAPPETVTRSEPRVGRNDPCPCGSGKKYKKCCGG